MSDGVFVLEDGKYISTHTMVMRLHNRIVDLEEQVESLQKQINNITNAKVNDAVADKIAEMQKRVALLEHQNQTFTFH